MQRGIATVACVLVGFTMFVPASLADPGAVEDGSLYFGLTDQTASGVSDARAMFAETPGTGATVGIPATEPVTWVADAPAETDFTTTSQDVVVHLAFTTVLDQDVTVTVGKWSSGSFQAHDDVTQSVSGTDTVTFTIPIDGLSVATGERPALQVATSGIATVDTSSATALHFDQTPPPEAYPTPEIGSLVLSGFGLVGLVATARIRRRAD